MSRTCSTAVIAVALAIGLAVVLASTPAAAQKADATTAFQRGQQLKRDGKIAEACAAFELSMKLEAQYGTQYNLALCYLDLGRTASAWAELDELSSKDPNQARRADAARRAHELRPRLTSALIKLARPVPGLVVTRDGIDVTILVGAPIPVDPGEHRFVARAPGRREWSAAIEITGEGKTVDVVVPALDAVVHSPPPPSTPAPEEASQGLPPSPDGRDEHVGRTRRIAGIAAVSVGVVAVAAGSWYGVRALARARDARALCGGDVSECTGEPEAARRLVDDGRHFATISNYTLAAGVVLAAGGVILYVTAPRGVTAAPMVGARGVGLAVSGRF